MKIIRKGETKIFKNSDNCTAIEYPLGDKDINGAIVEVSGRYPDKNRVINLKCKELAYILEGTGKLVIEDQIINFNTGDLLLIEAGEKYCWEGNFKAFVPCIPTWYPEQHVEVE